MLTNFNDKIRKKEMRNLRLLNVFSSIFVTLLGFIFEFSYHDGYILTSGLAVSMILTSNYFLSFYSEWYRRNFMNLTTASIFLLHFWAAYVAYVRNFEITILLPLSISTFTFSLVFDRYYKSLFFIFVITTLLMALMILSGQWKPEFAIAIVALYSGAFLSEEILKRKGEYQSEIKKQEQRYVSLVENMNDGLIYLDKSNLISFVNERFTRISDIPKEKLENQLFEALFEPIINAKEVRNEFENLLSGRTIKTEAVMKKQNGKKVWVQLVGSPYYDEDGSRNGCMIVYTDITSLKEIEELLKKREEGYKTFIDQSAVGIWRAEYRQPIPINLPVSEQIDLLLDTGIITECNDFMSKMYGHNISTDLIGRRIRDFYYMENNFDEERTRELMQSFVLNNYRISNAESKELDRSGAVRYMLNNNIGVVENGCLIRTWGVQTDITDRKKTEKELVETNQELDTFFYKASHDLKGPLASVMGIVNLARLENSDPLNEKYFTMIETSVKRLDRTLLDLIELARTRKGTSKLSQINIMSMVQDILHSLRHLPDFGSINFEVKIDHLLELKADKVLVLSVFQNLIHNAINYCNQDSPHVKIKVEKHDNGIQLQIIDNGHGIPEGIRDRVFEMFYRGHPDSTGSGLGLFIVKNALEKMKGNISFESEVGKGTTFTINIPNARTEHI
ncbi:MAG: PAS domain S-box protein [Bacteroidetes bacterium]|nr:PAS domain S-box protein [Bacteroidota bacterium]MBK9414178.1 PAS domain S-box protein [Bacteroidota bacterium]MBL0030735.1 PAS domain S-box protein [Bacteroidota bacterium]MBP6426150.1 PAS domain S-box protein [Bacteroidia bacterium]MBP6657821.1 PAS domain S-box protein [Bacteroidia bacterium]